MFSSFRAFFNSNTKSVYSVFIAFVVGVSIGVFTLKSDSRSISDNCPTDLPFVKAEQDCESFQNTTEKIQALQDTLKRQVNSYLSTKRADRISVFIRDLDSQKFAYVNESEEFYMASLLKVPLAVAYFRLAELTPDLLSQTIVYDGTIDLYESQDIKPLKKLAPGTYTVKELLDRALIYSDNTSAELLSKNYVSYDYLQKILFTLGLQPTEKDQSQNLVTARTYAGVFRTLYNSSFLSRNYSNTILDILAKSTFTEGAPALLPNNIKLSHKFAERSFINTQGQTIHQLHDCGVTYADNGAQAYSFCIMTEGKDFANLKSVIQNVSSTLYKGITE
jgi:beta-lactamase class A